MRVVAKSHTPRQRSLFFKRRIGPAEAMADGSGYDSMPSGMSLLRQYKGGLIWVIAAGLIINFISLLYPLYSSFVYDKVFYNGITDTLIVVSAGIIISECINFSIKTIRYRFLEDFSCDIERRVDHSVITKLLGTRERSSGSIGEFIERYKQLLGSREVFTSIYLSLLVDLPFTLMFILALGYVAGYLVLVPVFIGGLLIATQLLFSIPSRYYDRQARNQGIHRFNILSDILAGRDSLVCSQSADWMSAKWEAACHRVSESASKARYWATLSNSAFGWINTVSMVLILIGGAYLIQDQTITSGGLFAASILNGRIMAIINSVVQMIIRFRDFALAKRELDKLLMQGEDMAADCSPGTQALDGKLHLMGVSCKLETGGRSILKSISLSIESGERIALVGPPGAGKTTLLRVLAGRLPPSDGQVLLSGYPLMRIEPRQLAAAISYKAQDAFLFDGTIEENIRAGDTQSILRLDDPWLAASGLCDVITDGALNLAAPVGPRGTWLSGGQRQMVALARALFHADTRLVLLDEPTTGFDAVSEKRFADRIAALPRTKTFVFATHCQAVLMNVDRLIVIKDGQIIAQGPPSQLLS